MSNALPRPYYQDGLITIYHGDSRELLPLVKGIFLLLTDPPYGIRLDTKYRGQGRGFRGAKLKGGLAVSNDYAPIAGDDEPFDPTHLLGYPKVILFGANYYADKLPPRGGWLVWDKIDGLKSSREIGFNDNADAELAWTNLSGPPRICRHRWNGVMKASEKDKKRVHPTQKPIAVMDWCIQRAKHDAGLICDPYMGSGSTLIAARRRYLPAVGIELSEDYCRIAAERLTAEPLPLFRI